MIESWNIQTNHEICNEWLKVKMYKQTMRYVMIDCKMKCASKPWGL
jgi:hypothetical protein